MNELKKAIPDLSYLYVRKGNEVHYQKSVPELVEYALVNHEGILSDTGALSADTGRFTGRTPNDRFIVRDELTAGSVWWGAVNRPIDEVSFEHLFREVGEYLGGSDVFVRDCTAGADMAYSIGVRVVTEKAYHNLFAHNLFLRPDAPDPIVRPEWSLLVAPGYRCAQPSKFGLNQGNFVVISLKQKVILVAGTGYAGEIKKSIFSVMNYLLPRERRVLSMHCAANTDAQGQTALFFGLSGTGKTTLSADPERLLIGDDEHGWDASGVFNFEGGCYAKCVGLQESREPDIFRAIRFGAVVENIGFFPGTRVPDYDDTSKTENTRAAYPIHHVPRSVPAGMAKPPRHIFFLTADAFGVLPPISLLSTTQAMYHFLSGYTAKVAGTEDGVREPRAAFSACFGEAFLPLHPATYAELLRERLAKGGIRVWLVNTGWIAGPYGVGRRINLRYTRSIITAALTGGLGDAPFKTHPVFGLRYPTACPEVPDAIMDPVQLWPDPSAYDAQARRLATLFADNFERFADRVQADVRAAGPAVGKSVPVGEP